MLFRAQCISVKKNPTKTAKGLKESLELVNISLHDRTPLRKLILQDNVKVAVHQLKLGKSLVMQQNDPEHLLQNYFKENSLFGVVQSEPRLILQHICWVRVQESYSHQTL
uniref:Uncharacterized protein n=1 Tax=Lates calcarifer TaxID=8187 RepID=A0A4W6EPD6_LATCA